MESYFDPEKNSKAKTRQDKKEVKSESSKIIDDRENNNKCDSGTETPDTTSSSPINTTLKIPEIGKLSLED